MGQSDGAASSFVALVASVALGLSAGAMLTEAIVLVGFWRSLEPVDFLDWFRNHEPRLVSFFAPLQVGSAALTVLAAWIHTRSRRAGAASLWVAALLSVIALALYPLYFREANAAFATGTVSPDAVPAALQRWASWHWLRTAIGITAFIAASLALRHDRTE